MTTEFTSLIELRRDLHAHPETGWTEFYTTARLAEEFKQLGYKLAFGTKVIPEEKRLGVPNDSELDQARERAKREGAAGYFLHQMRQATGMVAEKQYGNGPVIGLRVDIDALNISESSDTAHFPSSAGFASKHPGLMHACGHDGHAAIGVGVARTIDRLDAFDGTLRIFCQPAEEGCRGGLAMSRSSYLQGVDALFSLHIGMGHDTGEIVAGFERPLANAKLNVKFTGEETHAGRSPEDGRNALQAATTAIQNLYGISRHASGTTRINIGRVRSPNPVNVVASDTRMRVGVRASTEAALQYMLDRAEDILDSSARMHDVAVDWDQYGRATTFTADEPAINAVVDAAESHNQISDVVNRAKFGASEDASYLIRRVQELGGVATYLGIGAARPAGHHTAHFDFDEDAIGIGVDVVADSIRRIARCEDLYQ
jgi:aminobenzoyl-glutamate utilization protein A